MSEAVATRRHPVRIIAIVCGVLLLAVVGVLATREPAEQRDASSPLLGQYAPDFQANKIDGGEMTLSDLKGKPIVLNFFASWCVPCKQEHNALKTFAAQHSKDASVVAVTFDDSNVAARKFFEQNGGDWPVVDDTSGKIALDWGVRGPPETFVIDADGVVRQKYIGQVTTKGLENSLKEVSESSS